MFESYLRDQVLEARDGQIIDATVVPEPKQRKSLEDANEVKAICIPPG